MSETKIIINNKDEDTPGAQAWAERSMNGKIKYGLHATGDNVDDAINKLLGGWTKLNKKYNDGLKPFNEGVSEAKP